MATKLYIVEDHPLMQRMLRERIDRLPNLQVIGVAATAEEALTQLATLEVDLVLVDVSLPGMNGIDLVRALLLQRPGLLCLMLSGHQESSYVQRALAAGARGYLAKGNPPELGEAIPQILQGGTYLSSSLHLPSDEGSKGD
ncbi:MAG: response regulator transcription factor [Caldilineaceae bacterium]|nr:response regulator transcription factor [Caldilineaceae bacterium]